MTSERQGDERRRSEEPSATENTGVVPSREEYFAQWATLHGGYDPASSWMTRIWLGWVHIAARPFVRIGASPDLLTVLGGVLSGCVAWLAALGGRWVLLAVVVVVLSGLVDNLDGAVAVMTGRTSRWGAVLDAVVDRVSDGLYLLALWFVGAPTWLCVAAGCVVFLLEYARARAGAVGLGEVGVITVGERPTRIIGTAMFLLGAGLYPSAAEAWATGGAIFTGVVGTVALLQLLVVVRRLLR